jgi:predicted esterase
MPQDEEVRPADACVLWLHGDEDTGNGWERLESDPMSGLGRRLPWVQWAFPTARSGNWFDYELPIIEASTEYRRVDDAVHTVHAMLAQIVESGIKPSRIVLGGHGPGAALALLAGRTYQHTLAGIAGLSGWYMRPRQKSSEYGVRTPVLLCHGEDDDDVPVELHSEACGRLRRDGVELSSYKYAGLGHKACARELTVLAAPKNFITDRLRTLTPAPALSALERRGVAAALGGDGGVAAALGGGGGGDDGGGDIGSAEAVRAEYERLNAAGCSPQEPKAPWRALDEASAAEMTRLAEHIVGGLAEHLGETIDPNMEEDPSRALAERLVDAAETAQRDVTACRLVSMELEGGTLLQVVLALDGVSSLAEADLSIGATGLELLLPGARAPFALPFPRRVDTDGADMAKFSAKTGRLKLTLRVAAAC